MSIFRYGPGIERHFVQACKGVYQSCIWWIGLHAILWLIACKWLLRVAFNHNFQQWMPQRQTRPPVFIDMKSDRKNSYMRYAHTLKPMYDTASMLPHEKFISKAFFLCMDTFRSSGVCSTCIDVLPPTDDGGECRGWWSVDATSAEWSTGAEWVGQSVGNYAPAPNAWSWTSFIETS